MATATDREADYLRDGVDSVWLPNAATPGEFANELFALLGDDERLKRLATSCRENARAFDMGSLVDDFVGGIEMWAHDSRR